MTKIKALAIKCILMASTFIVCHCIYGQDSTAFKIKLQADSLLKKKNFPEAHSKYLLALKKFEKNNNWEEWERGFLGLEKSALGMRRIKQLDSLPAVFSVVPIEEKYVLAKCHYNTAYAYSKMGRNYKAIVHYEKSLANFNALTDTIGLKKAKKYLPSVYNSTSVCYSRLGDQVNAFKYLNKGIEFSLKTEGNPRLCKFLFLIGKYYALQKRFEEAVKQYEKIINDCGEEEWLHNYIAELNLELNNLELAKIHINRYRELIEANQEELTHQYFLLQSKFNRKKQLHELAIKYGQTGLNLLAETGNDRTYAKELTIFSHYLYEIGKKEQSVSYAQKALSLFFEDLDPSSILSRPQIGVELPDIWVIESLETKAKYYRDKYHEYKDQKYLDEAKFYYDALFHYFDKTKSAYSSIAEQYNLGAYTQKIYAESIHFFAELYSQKKKTEYFEKAFDLAQSANAFVLKNSISERKSMELAGVPIDTMNKFIQLKSMSNNSDEEDSDAIKHLNSFKEFKNKLSEEFPAIEKLQKDQVISLESVQQVLNPNSILVKYYYEKKKLTRFTITNDSILLNVIDLPDNFNSLVANYQKLISNPKNWNERKYAETSKTIYSILIKDVLEESKFKNKKHLIIAPDGPIKKIAFNSMVTKEHENLLTAQDYLISDYEISYLYYCAQLNQKDTRTKDSNGFIGFGIEYNDIFLDELLKEIQSRQPEEVVDRDMTLSPLKYAKEEAMNSASILNGESILNEEATLTNVLSNINDYNHLHFSTHAFVDNEDFMNSFIALSKDQNEEYQLKYKDILNLNLNSDLVVLSACQTSSGTNISGEGLMSLSRAFVQSGCKSAIGAYWNAPDLSTMKIMELFYSNLKKGMTKSSSLRHAQIEFIENEEYSSPRTRTPFFWSSWAIYGDNASVTQPKNSTFVLSNKWLLLLLVIFSFSLIYLFFVNRKNDQPI